MNNTQSVFLIPANNELGCISEILLDKNNNNLGSVDN